MKNTTNLMVYACPVQNFLLNTVKIFLVKNVTNLDKNNETLALKKKNVR